MDIVTVVREIPEVYNIGNSSAYAALSESRLQVLNGKEFGWMRARSEKKIKVRLLRVPPTLAAISLALAVAGCSILREMPEMPEMPKWPEMPEMPEMPKWPEMPQLPEMPNWVNPTSWVGGLFAKNEDPVMSQAGLPRKETPFPKLGYVPKLKSITAAEERRIIANSLIADRDAARYTEQNLRAGGKQVASVPIAPIPKAKPLPPRPPKPSTVIPSTKNLVGGSDNSQLPVASRRESRKHLSLKKVPSIVQRRGSLPLPPTPIGEVSRGLLPQIIEKSGDVATVDKKLTPSMLTTPETKSEFSRRLMPKVVKKSGDVPTVDRKLTPTRLTALETKSEFSRRLMPKVVKKSGDVASVDRKLTPTMLTAPEKKSEFSRRFMPKVVKKTSDVATVDKKLTPTMLKAPESKSQIANSVSQTAIKLVPPAASQVFLPVGKEQSVLAQTYVASLAAQANQTVSQPGNVFNSPSASPIAGEWPTVVPGVVKQAFNAAIRGTSRRVLPPVVATPSSLVSLKLKSDNRRFSPDDPKLIRFDHGSTRISGEEKIMLRNLANQVMKSGKIVYVVGHASQRTIDMDYAKHKLINFSVSLDRANSVANELRRRGVSSEKLIVQAKGDNEPLYFEYMPNGEAQNRRVEIFIR